MKLQVERLTESPASHAYRAEPGWWREPGRAGAAVADCFEEPVDLALRAHRMGADLYLEGEVAGRLHVACSRCNEPLVQSFREPFRLVLEPAGHRVPADPEGARALAETGIYLSDEVESGWFRGPTIDLSAFFEELVLLLLPVQPLCREDCLGLCPRCGADRNREACACVETHPASPFAVLEKLRGQLSGGKTR